VKEFDAAEHAVWLEARWSEKTKLPDANIIDDAD
jgi:hypothetical protein